MRWFNRQHAHRSHRPPMGTHPAEVVRRDRVDRRQLARATRPPATTSCSSPPATPRRPVPTAWVLRAGRRHPHRMAVPELRHVMHAYEAVQDYDIVHDHTVSGPVYAERFPGLRWSPPSTGRSTRSSTDIYRRIAGRVPIIAISHDQRRHAPDIPIARVIHHGIDPAVFPVGRRRRRLLPVPRPHGAREGGPPGRRGGLARPGCGSCWPPRCASPGSSTTSTTT